MSIYRRVLGYLRPYSVRLVMSAGCALAFSLFSALSISLTMPLLDTLFATGGGQALTQAPPPSSPAVPGFLSSLLQDVAHTFRAYVFRATPEESLLNICIVTVIAFFFKNLFAYFESNFMAYVEQAVMRDIRDRLYRHIHDLPLAYFTNERTGSLIARVMNDVAVLNSGISATFFTLVREPLTILAYLAIALVISWKLTVMAFVIVPLAMLVIVWVGRRVRAGSGRVQERVADVTSVLQETISGVKVVKAFGMEEFETAKFRREGDLWFRTNVRMKLFQNVATPTTEFLSAVAGGVIIWFGGMEVLHAGEMKASEFLTFLFAIFQLMPPMKQLSGVNNRIQEAAAAGKRVFEVLDTKPNITNAANAVVLGEFKEAIAFRDVCFRYNEEMVLADVNISFRKGEVVAIVGPSGSGKSTLVDLIPRFYDPVSGSITIDGHDLRSVDLRSLRDKIGIVTQETILFNDTVRNNIAYGLENCPLESVVTAAKAANADGFIREMPKEYDSVIGERGVKISGGERQRLALARAILKNPPILILDEATSALDTESEILVQEAIERLMAGRTSIVIAHRLSTVQHADRILVLAAGRIVEIGRHEDLLRNEGGLYKKLYDLQFRL
jgi:subfamily B ATP-binding cassette protein MsbA